ncbi:MAG: helix-turn-helix transcriptional regulator [Pirellulaceae bacterium]|nr:helix-turn-helix transcriptional regulator [Pirellulaceae bacterium]
MGRPPTILYATTYAARVSARLRQLRAEHGFSMPALADHLSVLGRRVSLATLYAYERGKDAGGVDLPLELIPLIAEAYGFSHPGDWLPEVWRPSTRRKTPSDAGSSSMHSPSGGIPRSSNDILDK